MNNLNEKILEKNKNENEEYALWYADSIMFGKPLIRAKYSEIKKYLEKNNFLKISFIRKIKNEFEIFVRI